MQSYATACTVTHDLENIQLKEDTEDHDEWKRRTHVADLSPEGFTLTLTLSLFTHLWRESQITE